MKKQGVDATGKELHSIIMMILDSNVTLPIKIQIFNEIFWHQWYMNVSMTSCYTHAVAQEVRCWFYMHRPGFMSRQSVWTLWQKNWHWGGSSLSTSSYPWQSTFQQSFILIYHSLFQHHKLLEEHVIGGQPTSICFYLPHTTIST